MGSGVWSTDVYSLREDMRKRSGKSAFDYSARTTSDPGGPRVHPTLDPNGVHFRESRDSDEHPESLSRDRRVHHFDRDVAIERRLLGLVDRAHRATTEELLDDVLAVDGATDQRRILFTHDWAA